MKTPFDALIGKTITAITMVECDEYESHPTDDIFERYTFTLSDGSHHVVRTDDGVGSDRFYAILRELNAEEKDAEEQEMEQLVEEGTSRADIGEEAFAYRAAQRAREE